MSDQLDWHLLDRYFSGEASPHEAATVHQWAEGGAGRAEELRAIRNVWENAGTVRPRFDGRAAKATLHQKMAEPGRGVRPIRPPRFAVLDGKPRVWAAAASIAALLAGAAIWRVARSPSTASEVSVRPIYVTSRGERRQFSLADGTQVTLGPASRLTVARAYGAGSREVELEGEGYFAVTHDDRRPFAVHSGGAIVRDVGTRFDVRAYATDRSVRVVVAEGKVAWEEHTLSRGDLAVRGPDGTITVQPGVDVDRYLAWTAGNLVFQDTPLIDAIPELNRWYDLDFQLADGRLARVPLTGTLTDRPDAETIDLLGISLGVPVERHGNTVVIGVTRP